MASSNDSGDSDDSDSLFGEPHEEDASMEGTFFDELWSPVTQHHDTFRHAIGGANIAQTYQEYELGEGEMPGGAREPWHAIEELPVGRLQCARALVVNVPASMYRANADTQRDLAQWASNPVRAIAYAAIEGLLYAGVYQGLPVSDQHESAVQAREASATARAAVASAGGDDERGRPKKAVSGPKEYSRYFFKDEGKLRPSFQVAHEDLLDERKECVVGHRHWIFVYDVNHSHSALLERTMKSTAALKRCAATSAQDPSLRSCAYGNEVSRHDKVGVGAAELDRNFDRTVGFQYKRITNEEEWRRMLCIHGGGTGQANPGKRPFVHDVVAHTRGQPGRRRLVGSDTGTGGAHPLAPELVFNAKRVEALAFGLVGEDGEPLAVCSEQLDVGSYWPEYAGEDVVKGGFRIAVVKPNRPTFFLRLSDENRFTILNDRLPRPFVGSIVPGETLTRMYKERAIRDMVARGERLLCDAAADIDHVWERVSDCDDAPYVLAITADDHVAVRSFASGQREEAREAEATVRANTYTHDVEAAMAQTAAAIGGHVAGAPGSGGGETYTLRVASATDRVRVETERLHQQVIRAFRDTRHREATVPSGSGDGLPMRMGTEEVQLRFYAATKDLAEFHLRSMEVCFQSYREAQTLPAGWRAMYSALQRGISLNHGSASAAFSARYNGGRQLTCRDRTVWGELQQFLGDLFTTTCRIQGRDRRIMDEMYMTMFEPYTDSTFMLICASDKGKGKSVRAQRMAEIMPPGWCTFNSGFTAKAGMNGNMSPSNGTVVICDEMIADLTKAESDERMEFFKTILMKREYERDMVRQVKHTDGTDTHQTYKVVTDHRESYIICCNKGQCFTDGPEDPTSGKEAMIQRTVCLQVRSETTEDSPDDEFRKELTDSNTALKLEVFRLFTSLVGFVRCAMLRVQCLKPDLSFASAVHREFDRVLEEEYGMPPPEPRRLAKRNENLVTMCVMEAVAKVYLFKQTAVNYHAGRSHGNDGIGPPPFDIGDLWDVIRLMHPTREMILTAWAYSLEYSIGTSTHGVNLMSAIAERVGFVGTDPFASMTKMAPTTTTHEAQLPTIFAPPGTGHGGQTIGATPENIAVRARSLAEGRKTRYAFRRAARTNQATSATAPYEHVAAVAASSGENTSVALQAYNSALYPSLSQASMYYSAGALIQWAVGNTDVALSADSNSAHNLVIGSASEGLAPKNNDGTINFKELSTTDGRGKQYDFAWLVVHKQTKDIPLKFSVLAHELLKANSCRLFDMHKAGIADGLYMLASSENARPLCEMPNVAAGYAPAMAFLGGDGNAFDPESTDGAGGGHDRVRLRPVPVANGTSIGAHAYMAVPGFDTEPTFRGAIANDGWTDQHLQPPLDRIVGRGRLPALQPHVSANVTRGPPLRRAQGSGYEVNSVALYEHVAMKTEAALYCSRLHGLSNRQERFVNKMTPLNSFGVATATVEPGMCSKLPYSVDVMQIAWTSALARRFYHEYRERNRRVTNAALRRKAVLRLSTGWKNAIGASMWRRCAATDAVAVALECINDTFRMAIALYQDEGSPDVSFPGPSSSSSSSSSAAAAHDFSDGAGPWKVACAAQTAIGQLAKLLRQGDTFENTTLDLDAAVRSAYVELMGCHREMERHCSNGLAPAEVAQFTLRYSGYQHTEPTAKDRCLPLLSVSLNERRTNGVDATLLDQAAPQEAHDMAAHLDVMRSEASLSIGHYAGDDDVKQYLKGRMGRRHTHGVQGDLYSYDVYARHTLASMAARGRTWSLATEDRRVEQDKALRAMQDDETMCQARKYEKDFDHAKTLNLYKTTFSTYEHADKNVGIDHIKLPALQSLPVAMEEEEEADSSCEVSDVRTPTKRPRLDHGPDSVYLPPFEDDDDEELSPGQCVRFGSSR